MNTNAKIIAFALSAATSFAANALQVIEPVEGHNSFVRISAKELTRLSIDNGKVRSIIATEGELSMEKDEERGQVFFRPLVLDKPINIRVITSSGRTYSLIFQAVDMPQDDLVVRESGVKTESVTTASSASPHEKALTSLISAMAQEELPTNIEVRKSNTSYALWEGTKFTLVASYFERDLIGEKFELTNTGKDRIRIAEQELYRKGVIGVAIQNMTLDPGSTTSIYVVRSK